MSSKRRDVSGFSGPPRHLHFGQRGPINEGIIEAETPKAAPRRLSFRAAICDCSNVDKGYNTGMTALQKSDSPANPKRHIFWRFLGRIFYRSNGAKQPTSGAAAAEPWELSADDAKVMQQVADPKSAVGKQVRPGRTLPSGDMSHTSA